MLRPFALPDLAVLTGTEAAAFDGLAIRDRGVPEAALMERAGTAAAALVMEVAPRGPVLVLAGKGNNGGDALVAARSLTAWGREVQVLDAGGRLSPDPLLHGWPVPTRKTGDLDDDALRSLLERALGRDGALVDGILGTGITGAPRGEAARVLGLLEMARNRGTVQARVVALDIPSGVEADTGRVPGVSAQADVTVAFGWPKLGALLHPGRRRAGRLVAVEIGFPPLPPDLGSARLLSPAWARVHRPRRDPVTHKTRVGAVAVVAGRPGMAGAAILAGRAALRAGAGYVRVVSHGANREVIQAALPEAVFVDAGDGSAVGEALKAARAVAVGPAMGTDAEAAALLARVMECEVPRVVDADAITLLAGAPELREAVAGVPTVLTPHPGEAARLLEEPVAEAPDQRLAVIRRLTDRTGGVVLLKGTPSLVLGDRGLWVDALGTSDLAKAGMGDTLTGTIAAFLAQGAAPQVAAGLGLVSTGRAAERAAKGMGLQTSDVPEHLPAVLLEGDGETDLRLPGVLLDMDPPR